MSNAACTCRGILPGATRIASKRTSRIDGSELPASQISAAAAILRRCLALTDSAASSSVGRAFTSTNTSSWRRLAIMSISPSGLRHRRARMRNPFATRNAAARLSAEIPTRKAAWRSGCGVRRPERGGASLCVIPTIFGESERTLVDFAPGAPRCDGDLTDRIFHRHA